MAKFRKSQNRFWSGILSKKLKGSYDLEEYQSGCFQMENFLGAASGGAYQRPGSFFMTDKIYSASGFDATVDPTNLDNLYYFEITDTLTGVIRFSNAGAPSSSNTVLVIFNNITGAIVGTDTGGDFLSSAQGGPIEVPYDTEEKASGLRHIKVGSTFFFVHNSGKIAPFVMIMSGDTQVHLSTTVMYNVIDPYIKFHNVFRIPYDPVNIDPELVFYNVGAVSGSLGSVDVEMRDSGGFALEYWTTADIHTNYEVIVGGASVYWGHINSILSTTRARMTFRKTINTTAAGSSSVVWRRSSWGGQYGYPKTVFSAAGRIGYGGNAQYPLTLWFSLQGTAYHMMGARVAYTYTADTYFPKYDTSVATQSIDAFSFDITGQESTEIKWVTSSRNLEIGTDKEEYTYTGFDAAKPENNSILYQSSVGSSNFPPIKVGNATFFVGQDGISVHQILFDFNRSANSVKNISILSDDLFYGNESAVVVLENSSSSGVKIKKMVYDRINNTVWVLTNVGELFSVLLDHTSSAIGWQKHTLGIGNGDSSSVVDICLSRLYTSSTVAQNRRTLSLLTERTSGGTATYSIETMGFNPKTSDLGGVLTAAIQKVDCASYAYSASAKTAFVAADFSQGYSNLNNNLTDKTVHVIADGIYIGEKTLSGNDLTLDTAANYVVIGFYAQAILEPVPPVLPSQFGSHTESYRRFDRVEVKFFKSKYAEVGTPNSDMRPVVFEADSTLETLDHIQPLSANSEQEQTVLIKNTKPVPCNILSITYRGVLAD